MNDTTEMWRDHREAQKGRRAKRLPKARQDILNLRNSGHTVEALTEFQFRVDGKLDLYPTQLRYHNLKTGIRGNYRHADRIIEREIR